jgi:RimJ/RimL family protein N-acetyltransferase
MRLLPAGVGLAWVDERTPQLGIALIPAFQHQGYGPLTVHPQNPAIALYERCGFVKEGLRNTYHLMVARLK